ncbi:hypothetical protein Tco_1366390, partial [Tanacetum coccineum]
ETSLSEYDEEEQNVLHFSNSFPLDEIFPNNPKTIKDSDDDIDIAQPYRSLDANIVSWNYFSWMPLNLIINLYVPFGIPFDLKRYYKDGSHTNIAEAKILTHDMAPLPHRDLRHPWIRYKVYGYDEGIIHRFGSEVEDGVYWGRGAAEMGLDVADTLCFQLGVGDRYRGTTNVPHLLAHYLFRHAEGRKSGARLSRGYFIGCLAMHFGLLGRLNIYLRFGDTWAWVAPGPESQQVAAAGAHKAGEAGPAVDEGAQEEEMRNLRHDIVGLRGVVESFTTEQSRVSTWLISCMTQLMDASGHTYQAFDSTLIGSLQMPYQRRGRPRTSDTSTSAAPHIDDQPDP